MEFGDRIKELREKRGFLQRQLASSLDIDTAMLSKIEHGLRKAKRDQVVTIAKVLEVDPNQLLALWLADQVFDIVKDEVMADEALKSAARKIRNKK